MKDTMGTDGVNIRSSSDRGLDNWMCFGKPICYGYVAYQGPRSNRSQSWRVIVLIVTICQKLYHSDLTKQYCRVA